METTLRADLLMSSRALLEMAVKLPEPERERGRPGRLADGAQGEHEPLTAKPE